MREPLQRAIDAAAGVSLKPQHFDDIVEHCQAAAWFEVHPENYLVAGGPMLGYLERVRQDYPLSFHSVGMSLGSADGVNASHLRRLRQLVDRFEPALLSDHLSWSRSEGVVLHDLLPMPYTHESLRCMADNIDRAQAILGMAIAIENPTSYFQLQRADYSESEFLVSLAKKSGASILLDVNNVYVSARNHGFDARRYIAGIPPPLVSEIHLAGHTVQPARFGEILIDDHGSPVCDDVWQLFEFALGKIGNRPTLIEWDTHVPPWHTLMAEATAAQAYLNAQASLTTQHATRPQAPLDCTR